MRKEHRSDLSDLMHLRRPMVSIGYLRPHASGQDIDILLSGEIPSCLSDDRWRSSLRNSCGMANRIPWMYRDRLRLSSSLLSPRQRDAADDMEKHRQKSRTNKPTSPVQGLHSFNSSPSLKYPHRSWPLIHSCDDAMHRRALTIQELPLIVCC